MNTSRKRWTLQRAKCESLLQSVLCAGFLIGCLPAGKKAAEAPNTSNESAATGVPVQGKGESQRKSGDSNPEKENPSEVISPPGNITGAGAVTSGKRYLIKSALSLKCIGAVDKSTENGAPMELRTCNDDASQKFEARAVGDYFQFMNLGSFKILELRNKQTAKGTVVQQGDAFGSDTQLFQLFPNGAGTFHVRSKAAPVYLDVKEASKADGAVIHMWNFLDQKNQSWLFIETN